MTRFKILFISCMAVMGLFAVNAVGAQAAQWFVNGSALSGSKEVESTNGAHGSLPALGSFELSGTVLGNSITIVCTGESDKGTITSPSTDTDEITFSGCSAKAPWTACTVAVNPAKAKTELITVGGVLYDKFEPSATNFTTITIGVCSLKGTYPVKGSTAAFDSAAGTEAATHTLEFSPSISTAAGAALTFAGNSATLTGKSYVWLTAGGLFSAH